MEGAFFSLTTVIFEGSQIPLAIHSNEISEPKYMTTCFLYAIFQNNLHLVVVKDEYYTRVGDVFFFLRVPFFRPPFLCVCQLVSCIFMKCSY
jgi:hypothetical protein